MQASDVNSCSSGLLFSPLHPPHRPPLLPPFPLFFSFFFKVCGFHFRRAHEPNLLIFTQNRSGSHSHTCTRTLKTDTHSFTSSKWWKCVWDDGFGGKVGGLGSVLVWSHWGWQAHIWMHGYSDDTHTAGSYQCLLSPVWLYLNFNSTLSVHTYSPPPPARLRKNFIRAWC